MLKTNYHTHMKYCNHADGMVEDYVKKAVELGFYELGMSDHAPILTSFMSREEYESNWGSDSMRMDQVDDYLSQIEECKKKYPGINIYSGFESEYLPKEKNHYLFLRKKVDFMNLGVHFFPIGDKVINAYEEINHSNVQEYVRNCGEAMATGMFTTLVHPDLFFYGYKGENGEHVFDECCRKATRDIAELALKYDVYLEVNSNGLKYCKDKHDRSTWLYPSVEFWKIMKEYPVKILIGCDAHTPDALGNENVKLVVDFVKELGLNVSERMEIKPWNAK